MFTSCDGRLLSLWSSSALISLLFRAATICDSFVGMHKRPIDHVLGHKPNSAVLWIVILCPTCVAHRKLRHRRQAAIVRRRADNRQPRTTIGAIDKRIVISAVTWIE